MAGLSSLSGLSGLSGIGGGISPPGFQFEDAPDLITNWDSNVGVTVTGSGVSTWANQAASGADYDWTQGTDANRPPLVTNQINGYPIIQSDGINDFLALSGNGLNIFRNITGATMYFVQKMPNSHVANKANFIATTGASPTISRLSTSNITIDKIQAVSRRQDGVTGTAAPSADWSYETPGSFKIVSVVVNWQAATCKIYINGTLVVNNTSFTDGGGPTSDTASQVARLFTDAAGGTASDIGFAHILAYQSAHDDTNRTAVETKLANRYQIAKRFIACDGDSGTAGGMSVILIDRDERWPSQLNSNLAQNIGVVNYAVSGNTIAQRTAAAPTGINIHPFPSWTTERICHLWGGANDIKLGATATQTYNNLLAYLAQARDCGNFDAISYGTPMANINITPTIQEFANMVRPLWLDGTLTNTYNVRYFTDIAADPRWDTDADTSNTDNYQTDQIHQVEGSGTGPTATGYAGIAWMFAVGLGLV